MLLFLVLIFLLWLVAVAVALVVAVAATFAAVGADADVDAGAGADACISVFLLMPLLSADETLVDALTNDVAPKASNVMGILYFGMLYGLTGHLQVRCSAMHAIRSCSHVGQIGSLHR